jgi:hypothetical protein
LKSAVVLFPLLAGGFLTFLGGERLYEANTVQGEKWIAPYGLLAFSSTQMREVGISLRPDFRRADLLQSKVPCEVWLVFQPLSYDGQGENEEDAVVGVQFPFRVVNPDILQFFSKTEYGETEISIKDVNVSIVEENDLITSVFYVQFTPLQITGLGGYVLVFSFDWEGVVYREDFSSFTFTLPVALGVEPLQGLVHPYTQNPNAHFVYYGDKLNLTAGMWFSSDFEVKHTFPEIEMMRTETGMDAWFFFFKVNANREEGTKAELLVTVDFEDKKLTETRSQLLFDSGLYIGLGVALVFSGIHEAIRVLAELREKGKPS